MRTITLEEHFTTQEFLKATGQVRDVNARMQEVTRRLLDIGAGRIADMDAGKIDMLVMSPGRSPAVQYRSGRPGL